MSVAVGCVADVSEEYGTLMLRVYVAGVVTFRCKIWPRSQSSKPKLQCGALYAVCVVQRRERTDLRDK